MEPSKLGSLIDWWCHPIAAWGCDISPNPLKSVNQFPLFFPDLRTGRINAQDYLIPVWWIWTHLNMITLLKFCSVSSSDRLHFRFRNINKQKKYWQNDCGKSAGNANENISQKIFQLLPECPQAEKEAYMDYTLTCSNYCGKTHWNKFRETTFKKKI